MKIILILSVIFCEYLLATNANVEGKAVNLIDMSDENCVASCGYVKREITKENLTQNNLIEQHPLISERQLKKRNTNGLELETAHVIKNEIVSRQKRRISHHRHPTPHLRIVAIKAKELTVDNTHIIKEILKASVEHVKSLYAKACNNIKHESQTFLLKLINFANEAEKNIKDYISGGELLKAQALASTNADEAYTQSFTNAVQLPSKYYPVVEEITKLMESNAINILKISISADKKIFKVESRHEGLRSYIDAEIQKISYLTRKYAEEFSEIAQIGVDKLKVYSDNMDRLFIELADNYSPMFLTMVEQNDDQEDESKNAMSELIKQIKQSNTEKYDDVFRSTSESFKSLLEGLNKDIDEIVKKKFKLQR